jgi:hypothetical protein
MKKKHLLLIVFIFLILSGCNKGEALGTDTLVVDDIDNIELDSINRYEINVTLDSRNKTYTGEQTTTYVNNTGEVLDEIYFHLYPNAYKTVDSAPILFDRSFSDPISYIGGWIDIVDISRDDENLDYSIVGEDETILRVKLDEPLEPQDEIEIYMEYEVKLPSSKDRFGYGDRTINVGNWYPILCVYDEDGWDLEPYYKIGDPFYSDIADYDVNITTEKDIVIASSGNILTDDIQEDKRVYQIEGKLLRDFAWSASKEFKIKESKVDDTVIKLYYLDGKSTMIKQSLEVAANSIKKFNKIFGKYPYGQYSIVMTEFPSGMEYPGIVFISNEYFDYTRRDMLETVIVHETAHQWWYGIVGLNQIKEAWLDESLATYSEVIYTKEVYGKARGKEYYNRQIRDGYDYGQLYLGDIQIVNKHLKYFSDWDEYGILVYAKGPIFFDQIKRDYGEKVLYNILSEFYNSYKFKNATTEDLINVCELVTGDNFTRRADRWLNN